MNRCKKHKPKKLGYIAWHAWARKQAKAGLLQQRCYKCKLWYFPSENP